MISQEFNMAFMVNTQRAIGSPESPVQVTRGAMDT
jgi:hypothetical protein